jgi:phosphotransferase family enzyme
LRKLFATRDVVVTSSSYVPLEWVGMQPSQRALYRWSGRAAAEGADRDWSLILKVSRRDPNTDRESAWNYWKREFLAYTSGVLDGIPGIAAPRLLGSFERDGEFTFLLLEEVTESVRGPWPAERYVLAARHLGSFNGAYLADRAPPDRSFFTRRYLRSWTTWVPWIEEIRSAATWSDPLIAPEFRDPPIARLERLHDAAPALFDRLERLPQTLSHLDAWRANLIGSRSSDGREATLVIDWSFVGLAPAGQELAIMVGGSHIWLDAEPRDLKMLSERAFAIYVAGMRDAGWRGDERVVRFAYAGSAALYAVPMVMVCLGRVADPARREWLERKCRRPIQEIVRGWAILLDHVLALGDEANRIAEELG